MSVNSLFWRIVLVQILNVIPPCVALDLPVWVGPLICTLSCVPLGGINRLFIFITAKPWLIAWGIGFYCLFTQFFPVWFIIIYTACAVIRIIRMFIPTFLLVNSQE